MSNNFIISQIIVIVAYGLLGVGFLNKAKLKILKFSIGYNILMMIHYVLLCGTMGIVSSIINTSRSMYFEFNEKKGKENSPISLIFFCGMSIALGIIFYSSPVDIVPCILAVVGSYTYWVANTKKVRVCNLICSVCYIIYAIYLNSWMVIVCELYLIITTIIGLVKYEKSNNENKI